MYCIKDKRSSEFYGTDAFVAKGSHPKTDIVLFKPAARQFKTIEAAKKFIRKTFTSEENYDII